ncbi:ABC transporter ATP-binding protein [Kocuria sp.]|uniref:ABC transporter ATP-binding protein n=1 Tax=Kocuria sp. TaxID=1871328 RepID=UPI0026DEEAB6|nr:ABC transporter ATP-binding protein [Kocuria sp.]MDO5617794.1 ABC transporter ATP-binding protein [Kocuria sp.]
MSAADSLFQDPNAAVPEATRAQWRAQIQDRASRMAAREPAQRVIRPAVVIDDVTMIYTVTSTGGEEENQVHGVRRLARRALGRPPIVNNQALTSIRLLVEQGEFVGFIGRNGSGKSTLMNIVAGQMNPTRGRVWAVDRPAKLGVNVALVPGLSGERNIRLGCLAQGMTPRQVDAVFDELVEVAALDKALYWPMKAYSSGMAARLRFAVATATNPDILILDEALNTGDAQFQARGKQRMQEIRKNAGCVLFVSHSMSEIRNLCTRVVWIDDGHVVMDGHTDEVVDQYDDYMQQLADGNLLSAKAHRDELAGQYQPPAWMGGSL